MLWKMFRSLDSLKRSVSKVDSPFGGRTMDTTQLHDAEYWRSRVDEALNQAKQIGDVRAKRALLAIAENYEQLAEQAEGRGKTSSTNPTAK
jgi:hypothetical protein